MTEKVYSFGLKRDPHKPSQFMAQFMVTGNERKVMLLPPNNAFGSNCKLKRASKTPYKILIGALYAQFVFDRDDGPHIEIYEFASKSWEVQFKEPSLEKIKEQHLITHLYEYEIPTPWCEQIESYTVSHFIDELAYVEIRFSGLLEDGRTSYMVCRDTTW